MKKLFLAFMVIAYSTLALGNYNLELPQNYNEIEPEREARGDWNRLMNQTISTGILTVGVFGTFFIFKDFYDIGGWDEDIKPKDFGSAWKDNVKVSPVWDRSKFSTNYIGHPYVGSTYYIAARKSDFNKFDSFVYSALISAFFWEFGIEAIMEPPSIQDLIVTPVFGSILGEYLYRQEQKIIENNGEVFGSKFWGKTALVLIDPIGSFSNLIGFKDDQVMGAWNFSFREDGQVNSVGLSVGVSF